MNANANRIVGKLLIMGEGEREQDVFADAGLKGLVAYQSPNFLVIEETADTGFGVPLSYYPIVVAIGKRLMENNVAFGIKVYFNPTRKQ